MVSRIQNHGHCHCHHYLRNGSSICNCCPNAPVEVVFGVKTNGVLASSSQDKCPIDNCVAQLVASTVLGNPNRQICPLRWAIRFETTWLFPHCCHPFRGNWLMGL